MFALYEVDDLAITPFSARLVLLELAIHADRRGVVRMPQTELAAHSGLSPRAVANALGALVTAGHLERQGHGRYRLLIGQESRAVPDGSPEQQLESRILEQFPLWYRESGSPAIDAEYMAERLEEHLGAPVEKRSIHLAMQRLTQRGLLQLAEDYRGTPVQGPPPAKPWYVLRQNNGH